MEITHPSPQSTSPNSTSSSSSSSSSSCRSNSNSNSGGNNNNSNNSNNAATPFASNTPATPTSAAAAAPAILPRLPNVNSKPVDSNPHPTTFIQADTASFKQVVQMLTGSAAAAGKHASPLPRNAVLPPKRPAFKLYERRSGLRNLKTISPLAPAAPGFSPRRGRQQLQPEILSPSVLDFPALALSPVTPLNPDPFNRSPPQPNSAAADEERAIAEKGFYLHPSPRSAEPPRLLPLFPVTSPRACPPSAAAAAATGSSP